MIFIGKLIYLFLCQAAFLSIYKVILISLFLKKSKYDFEKLYEKFSFFRIVDCYFVSLICLAVMRSVFQEYSVLANLLSIGGIYSSIVFNDPVKSYLSRNEGIDVQSNLYDSINSKLTKYVYFSIILFLAMLYFSILRFPLIYDIIKLTSTKIFNFLGGLF